MTSLSKSLSNGNVNPCASRHAFSAKNVSTLIPTTWPDKALSSVAESRNVHISFVHVGLNAAGKNSKITGPASSSARSDTGFRSVSSSVNCGARVPTSMDIVACAHGLNTILPM